MRLYTVLATAFFLLALVNVVAANAAGVSSDTTRLAGENSVDKRHLRNQETYEDGDERKDEERGFVRFWIWEGSLGLFTRSI
ncbi:hypothetical protein PHYSODRAFT_285817 [Phytophthora sojae]|uniref:RxLR effector protein n=2 Tax=Phytophthora sojae TaxID=67593 RepID=G4ZFU3_PHYSP|nr:hypothetical protein PHYSODRAFT_285817 [Phytophthora sojae]AEK80969.1 Avh225 [Phytophthora sojae]AEK80970.1 Avh225 [Phytophthora sojae]AEK80971.1 Avh225 [Phytophthora sojae]EGZ16627.1 hypothetical protein PHYSODRAFT_285817 [Phytophthora sojae]|eukprot:XP_009525685.1 hypothetical protein PHYSODRAFT_285817 [Phytophthora sojae]